MAEFKPINSQEEFDAIIKDRIEQARKSAVKDFADYDSIKNDLNTKKTEIEKLTAQISELNGKNADLAAKLSKSETDSAKTRIAHEEGLPFELVGRLTGNTEDEIREDAKTLAKLFGAPTQPLYNPESGNQNTTDAAYKTLLGKIKSAD